MAYDSGAIVLNVFQFDPYKSSRAAQSEQAIYIGSYPVIDLAAQLINFVKFHVAAGFCSLTGSQLGVTDKRFD